MKIENTYFEITQTYENDEYDYVSCITAHIDDMTDVDNFDISENNLSEINNLIMEDLEFMFEVTGKKIESFDIEEVNSVDNKIHYKFYFDLS